MKALQPERTTLGVVQESTGAIFGNLWQLPFWAHLDAFLSATKSIAEIIGCCFGVDRTLEGWVEQRSPDERSRRKKFQNLFISHLEEFSKHPLVQERNDSEHRLGHSRATVDIPSLFGPSWVDVNGLRVLMHTGGPVQQVPIGAMREMGDHSWMNQSYPLRPRQEDFKILEEKLFSLCRDFLEAARRLVNDGRRISAEVHQILTPPPRRSDERSAF